MKFSHWLFLNFWYREFFVLVISRKAGSPACYLSQPIRRTRAHCGAVPIPWWRHQMETSSALMAPCEGNPPVTAGFSSQGIATQNFNVALLYARTNDWANSPYAGDLRRHGAHCSVTVMFTHFLNIDTQQLAHEVEIWVYFVWPMLYISHCNIAYNVVLDWVGLWRHTVIHTLYHNKIITGFWMAL